MAEYRLRRCWPKSGFALVAACCFGFASVSVLAAGSLLELGSFTSSGSSNAGAVSQDGSVVVGSAVSGPLGETAAFRWTQADGLVRLAGGGGKIFGQATSVSGDGSVVVGNLAMPIAYIYGAFRWSQSAGMISLGFLNGGARAFAYGVSTDGNVVVGGASDGAAGGAQRAYRWTEGGGMVSLGTLAAGVESVALGANADGTVIVGSSGIDSSRTTRAFLWRTTGAMTDLGVLPGLPSSIATAVNGAGNVVVGGSVQHDAGGNPDPTSAGSRAFRWTASGGMTSLGTINGGVSSYARGISNDGTTVVGFATDGAAGNVQRAFRWTQATGMQKVEDWLRANGVRVAADRTSYASGVNSDGSVVVGTLDNDRAFVARVTAAGGGMVSLDEIAGSLAAAGTAVSQSVATGQLLLHGVHGNPLAGRVAVGQSCLYVSADAGRDDHGSRDGSMAISEAGACRRLSPGLQIGAGLGVIRSRQALAYSGTSSLKGDFALVEALWRWAETNLWSTLSGVYQSSEIEIRRGYLNAGLPDASRGRPSATAWGLRFRTDWENLVTLGQGSITPYLDVSRFNAGRAGYTEIGGGFPATYDGQSDHSTEFRLGAVSNHAISADIRVAVTLEGVHRLESTGSGTSGQLVGLSAFNVPGQGIKRDWLRAGAAIESKMGPGVVTLALNATTAGEAPTYWLNLTYRVPF